MKSKLNVLAYCCCFIIMTLSLVNSASAVTCTIIKTPGGQGNRTYVTSGNEPTASCENTGTTCILDCCIMIGSESGSTTGPYNQLVVSAKVDTLTGTYTVTNGTSQLVKNGFTFGSNEFTLQVIDCPENRSYEGMSISMEGVTLASDGSFTVVFPPLPQ